MPVISRAVYYGSIADYGLLSKGSSVVRRILLLLAVLSLLSGFVFLMFGCPGPENWFPVFYDSQGRIKLIIWNTNVSVSPFVNNYSIFLDLKSGKVGYLNKKGEIEIPARFEQANPFWGEKSAVIENGIEVWIDKKGKKLVSLKSNLRTVQKNLDTDLILTKNSQKETSYCFVDSLGNIVIKGPFNNAHEFTEGYAAVECPDSSRKLDKSWCFIDRKGKRSSEAGFQKLEPLSEGLSAATVRDAKGILLSGYVDSKSNFVIPPIFKNARQFKSGIAAVNTPNGWGYIDKLGNFLIQPQFQQAGDFSEGLAPVEITEPEKQRKFPHIIENYGRNFGFIDRHGNWKMEPHFYSADSFRDGLARVFELRGLGNETATAVIDKNGKIIVPYKERSFVNWGDNAWIRVESDKLNKPSISEW